MLQRTGADIAPQTHQRPQGHRHLARTDSGHRANPTRAHLMPLLALDASRPGRRSCVQLSEQVGGLINFPPFPPTTGARSTIQA